VENCAILYPTPFFDARIWNGDTGVVLNGQNNTLRKHIHPDLASHILQTHPSRSAVLFCCIHIHLVWLLEKQHTSRRANNRPVIE